MSDTIYYKGTLKRTYSPKDVYEKCTAAIKKSGPTKNWTCTYDAENQLVAVDFGDGESETMTFQFENKKLNGFCKVFFSMDSQMYDKKSPFFACMKMLYSFKKLFSEYEVSDDYDAWEGFLEAMKYRAKFRELTEAETARVKTAFDNGCKNPKDLLLLLMAKDLQLPDVMDFPQYILKNPIYQIDVKHYILIYLETWLHKTCTFGKHGRVSDISKGRDTELNIFSLSLAAFTMGVEELYPECFSAYGHSPDSLHAFGVKHAIIRRMYREKFTPAFEAADEYEKCILAYRFFLSALDFAGFQYVGMGE